MRKTYNISRILERRNLGAVQGNGRSMMWTLFKMVAISCGAIGTADGKWKVED